MISGASHFKPRAVVIVQDPGEVGVHRTARRLHEEGLTVFGAEDEVNVNLGERLRDRRSVRAPFQGLK